MNIEENVEEFTQQTYEQQDLIHSIDKLLPNTNFM